MVEVKDKYSSATDNDTKKLVMSNGAYAVCEMVEILIEKIGKLTARLSAIK